MTAPERIVTSERFETADGAAEFVSTTELEEIDGQTRLTRTIRYTTPPAKRDRRKGPAEREASFGYDGLGDLFTSHPACDG